MKNCLFRYRTACITFALLTVIVVSGCKSKDTVSIVTSPGQTDNTPPTVTTVAPADGATDVPINSTIIATFSEAMEAALLTINTFIVFEAGNPTPLTGTVVYDPATRTATFSLPPGTDLTQGALHTVTITTDVEDLAMNNMLAIRSWSFTVGILPDIEAPVFSGISTATGTSTSTISLAWTAATDNVNPQNVLRYEICQSEVLNPPTNAGECLIDPFPAASATVTRLEATGGQTTFGVTGLKKNTTYDYVVRAKDLSNNVSGNIEQVSATTFGNPVPVGTGSLNFIPGSIASSPSIALIGEMPYLTWEENRNVYFRTFDGTDWTTPGLPLNDEASGKEGQQPRVASDGAMTPTAYLTFTECDANESNCEVLVRRDAGTGWQSVEDASTRPGCTPGELNIDCTKSASDSAIAFDSTITPYVVWSEIQDVNMGGIPPVFAEKRHIFVKHFDAATSTWIQDGSGPLNVDTLQDGFNPTIAINGLMITVSWKECVALGNCKLFAKEWPVGGTPPVTATNLTPNAPICGIGNPGCTEPDDPSLAVSNGTLFAAWRESGQLHVQRDPTGVFTDIEDMGFIIDGSNNTLLFIDDGTSTPKTATIPPGSYAGDELATRLGDALTAASAIAIHTASFDSSTGVNAGKFTITNGSATDPLDLLFEDAGTTAGEILGFNPTAGTSLVSDFDARDLNLSLVSNTSMAGTPSGPYIAFVKIPNTTSDLPELFVRFRDITVPSWKSVVDGKLNMTRPDPSRPINASIAVSPTGPVFVAWVEAGVCIDPGTCGGASSTSSQLYVKQLK